MLLKTVKCGVRLTVPLVLAFAMLTSLPPIVHAAGEVDLELGGGGATSWNITDIKPGDSGNKTVTLHNAGYKAGSVTIWISEIVSSEGVNPESETGEISEPGELNLHLIFDVTCSRLSTNLGLPVTIDNLPQNSSDPSYIKISSLGAGETINLQWLWELPILTGNEVNGDNLSFTINYLLEELPLAPSGPSGSSSTSDYSDDGDIDPTHLFQVNVLTETTWLKMWSNGLVRQTAVITDPDGNLVLKIDSGTKVTCGNDKVPTRIDLMVYDGALPLPEDMVQIGPVYSLTTYIDEVENDSARFEPPVRITLNFNSVELPDNVSSVFIAYYNVERGYIELEPLSFSAIEACTAEADVNDLSLLGIVAKLDIPPPAANFQASNLTINPTQAQWNQPVNISLMVTNNGGTMGSYILPLIIDGNLWTVKEIILEAGSSETINFEVTDLTRGEHIVEIAGLTGHLKIIGPVISPPQTIIDWSLLGLLVVVIVVGVLCLSSIVRARISRIKQPSEG